MNEKKKELKTAAVSRGLNAVIDKTEKGPRKRQEKKGRGNWCRRFSLNLKMKAR